MRKKGKELKGLTPVNIPVPPMLASAIGYKGEARFASFQWTPYGDVAEYSDGRMSATGNWQGFLAYIQHPAVSPPLEKYDLGSSESEAKYALILDREEFEVFIAPVREAEDFLKEQWPTDPTTRRSQEEYVAKIDIALKKMNQPRKIDVEEIQQRIKEQFALIEAMQQWLD
jgi:hypothetical protein